jgi:hypothetical protein
MLFITIYKALLVSINAEVVTVVVVVALFEEITDKSAGLRLAR